MSDECPRARQDGLIIEPIGEELLVFDTETSRAHSLNTSAAAVFGACDGSRSAEEIIQETGLDADAVILALADLAKSGLLLDYSEPVERVSRRAVIRRLAVTGAGLGVAVPVIRSIVAPSAAMAGTRTLSPRKGPCNNTSSCSDPSNVSCSNHQCLGVIIASCHSNASCKASLECINNSFCV